MWRGAAARAQATTRIIEVVCSDGNTHRGRLTERVREIDGFPEPSWDDVLARRDEWEPWQEPRLPVDSTVAPADNLAEAVSYISRWTLEGRHAHLPSPDVDVSVSDNGHRPVGDSVAPALQALVADEAEETEARCECCRLSVQAVQPDSERRAGRRFEGVLVEACVREPISNARGVPLQYAEDVATLAGAHAHDRDGPFRTAVERGGEVALHDVEPA